MEAMTDIMALNDSITDVQGESGLMQRSMTKLNDSIITMNSDNMALKATVLQLNDSQLKINSMFPDWPDAIACNITNIDDEYYFGVYIHYLVVAEAAREFRGYPGLWTTWTTPLYVYRWDTDNDNAWDPDSPQSSAIYFQSDGSYYTSQIDDYLRANDCHQKSIQELRDTGLAFSFLVN